MCYYLLLQVRVTEWCKSDIARIETSRVDRWKVLMETESTLCGPSSCLPGTGPIPTPHSPMGRGSFGTGAFGKSSGLPGRHMARTKEAGGTPAKSHEPEVTGMHCSISANQDARGLVITPIVRFLHSSVLLDSSGQS